MSEYQYYEFQAIDRPLTETEMGELRAFSTRARITPTSFVNDYAWGSFRGNADAWMEKYFDAYLYLANWGTRIFKLRLPVRLLDAKTARLYCAGERLAVREKSGKSVITFQYDDDEGGHWVEGEGHLASLISVRAELARGDLRALYLGWLLCVQSGELDEDTFEPPVPSGLRQLSAPLKSLVEFLRIDTDLVDVAAQASPMLVRAEPKLVEVREWLATVPVKEKDDALTRLIVDNDGALANELIQRMKRDRGGDQNADKKVAKRRTVAELVRNAEQASDERQRIAAEKAAKEKLQLEHAAAIARAKALDQLAGKEPMLWEKVESLIATTQPKNYDQAVGLLMDLRDLNARKNGSDFRPRVEALRSAHGRKPTLIERFRKAGF